MIGILRNKAMQYRWELVLFFGVSLAAWSARELSYLGWRQGAHFDAGIYLWNEMPGLLAALCVLAVSYRWVRRLQRPTLVAIWQFAIAAIVLAIPFSVAYAIPRSILADTGLSIAMYLALGTVYLQLAVRLLLLVRFSKQVSRWGVDKPLVLIAVSLFPWIMPPSPGRSLHPVEETGIAVLLVAMSFIAIRAVHHSDSHIPLGGKGLAILFVVGAVAFLSRLAPSFIELGYELDWYLPEVARLLPTYLLYSIVPHAVVYVLAVVFAYRMRVRPTSPPDHTVKAGEDFVGLYRRKAEHT